MAFCEHCGTEIPRGALLCKACQKKQVFTGTAQKDEKACPFCGEDILAVAIKCKHCGSILDSSPDGAIQTEKVLLDVRANLFRGIEGVGGRLRVTSRRVLFEPHAMNFQNRPVDILLSDIAEVSKRKTMGLVPNGLLIRTKSAVEYKLVVLDRERLISIIESRMPRA